MLNKNLINQVEIDKTIPSNFQISEIGVELLYENNTNYTGSDITICIPTFRREIELLETLKSAYNQNQSQYNVIILSNDEKFTIHDNLRTLLDQTEINTRIYRNKINIGPFQNWNRAAELAQTDYITILHDDDFLLSTFISDSRKYLLKFDNFVFRGGINKNGYLTNKRLIEYGFSRQLKTRHFLHFHITNGIGMVLKKSDFLFVGGYNPAFFPYADHIFNLHFSSKFKLFYIKKTNSIYTYKTRTDSDEYYESATRLKNDLLEFLESSYNPGISRSIHKLGINLDYELKLFRHINKTNDLRFKQNIPIKLIVSIYGISKKIVRYFIY